MSSYVPYTYFSFIDFHSIKPGGPNTLIWDVTYRCNLRCIHCYNSDRYKDPLKRRELNTEEAKLALKKIRDFGFKHVHLLGGEPLVRRDIVEIVSYATKIGLRVTINTNGTLLTYELAKKLVEAGVDQITVSIDGATEVTNDYIRGKGTYKKILKALEVLNKLRDEGYKIEIGLAYTMTKINLHEMPMLLELAHKYNVDIVDFMSLYISGEALRHPELHYTIPEVLDALERLAQYVRTHRNKLRNIIIQLDVWYPTAIYLERKYRVRFVYHPRNMGCMAVVDRWYMESDGTLHPCGICNNLIYSGKLIEKGELIPENLNILKVKDLREVLRSKYFISFLKLRANKKRYLNKYPCKVCEYFSICIPCPIINYDKEVIEECAEVFKREKEFEEFVRSLTIKLKKEYVIAKEGGFYIFDREIGKYRKVKGSGNLIINMLLNSDNVSVDKLIREVEKAYPNVSKRQIERDVVDFIWWLILIGVIERAD